MKKLQFLLLLSTLLMASCYTNVKSFGNIGFTDDLFTNWLYADDTIYYYAGTLDENVKKGSCVGAFNQGYQGHKAYLLQDYQNLLLLEINDVFDVMKFIYIKEDGGSVPTSLLFDLPHKDDLIFNGENIKVNNETFSIYGSGLKRDLISNHSFFVSENNIDYYQFDEYPQWIFTNNKNSDDYVDVFYSLDINELPFYFIKLTSPII